MTILPLALSLLFLSPAAGGGRRAPAKSPAVIRSISSHVQSFRLGAADTALAGQGAAFFDRQPVKARAIGGPYVHAAEPKAPAPNGLKPAAAPLDFSIHENGGHDYFHQSGQISFHLQLQNAASRITAAFPAGNSGIALNFDGRAENAGLRWSAEEAPRPWIEGSIRGVASRLKADRAAVVLASHQLDNMRLLRSEEYEDYGARIREREKLAGLLGFSADGWAKSKIQNDGRTVVFRRHSLDRSTHYEARLVLEGPTEIVEREDGSILLRRTDGRPLELRFMAGTDIPQLTPLLLEELLSPEGLRLYREARSRTDDEARRLVEAVDSLRFLSFREKFMAGSPRYLTYFGRDTLLTTLLSGRLVTKRFREYALRSVLDRLSPLGDVAHEEDIFGQAERVRVQEALKLLEGIETKPEAEQARLSAQAKATLIMAQRPIYDYKMIDDDFLLILLAAQYFSDPAVTRQERAAFLNARSPNGSTYRELFARNLEFAIDRTAPYAREAQRAPPSGSGSRRLARFLIPFKEFTGDWRDSRLGNGLGKFSASVNAHIVPHALAALPEIAAALGPKVKRSLERKLKEQEVRGGLGGLAAAWKDSRKHFEVSLNERQARTRLGSFLLSLPAEEREYFAAQARRSDLSRGVAFTAIALDEALEPIPVMHSDAAFDLFFGRPSSEEVDRIVELLTGPFPVHLRLEKGVAIANPAFSGRPDDYEIFGEGQYHGWRNPWGWPMTLIEEALLKRDRFEAADLVKESRAAAGSGSNRELYALKVKDGKLAVVAFRGKGESRKTEINPVQLWSSLMPALVIERQAVAKRRSRAREGSAGSSSGP